MQNGVTLDQAGTMCRAFGHSWHPIDGDKYKYTDIRIRAGKTSWDIYVQCERCTAKRYDLIGATGQLIKRKYSYPNGYKRSRVPRPDLRLELKTVLKVWGNEREIELW